jgi:hypothetical protein
VANAPLLQHDREIRVQGQAGGGDEVDYLVQGSVAASVRPSLGVYSSVYLAGGAGGDRARKSGFGGAWDAGVGYYRRSDGPLRFEAIGAIQYGRAHNDFDDGRVSYHLYKPYGQVNVGYRGRRLEVVVAQRVGRLAYVGIAEDWAPFTPRPDTVADLIATSPSFLYEPSVSVRIGGERLKFGADLGFARNLSGTRLRYDRVSLGLGMHYTVRPAS